MSDSQGSENGTLSGLSESGFTKGSTATICFIFLDHLAIWYLASLQLTLHSNLIPLSPAPSN